MSKVILGPALPNIPWQEKPADCRDVVWRYKNNPIIKRDAIPTSNSIFNSAVVPFGDGFRGVFRCDNTRRVAHLHAGYSDDGINWTINPDPIKFICDIPEVAEFILGYDPRVCLIEDRYIITWCNAYKNSPTIGVAYTYDFKDFYQLENAFLPYNRNGVMFPRKINGKYAMLSRPSDVGHTPFGDIYYSESPDLTYWGKHRLVMATIRDVKLAQWQGLKIGAGPIPIETKEGWLLIYHGVLASCNGYVYCTGAALLDLDEPWKVKYRALPYILAPDTLYERVGDVSNVVFPCAALADADTGRIAIYYGAADTVTALAFTTAGELIDFIKENS